MVHRIVINKLGPIEKCDLTCTPFMAFTGVQASGKSTIAKAIFYFRTIKDDIYNLLLEAHDPNAAGNTTASYSYEKLLSILKEKFSRMFGPLDNMNRKMSLEYYYSEKNFVRLSIGQKEWNNTPAADLEFSFSAPFIKQLNNLLNGSSNLKADNKDFRSFLLKQKKELETLFNDSRTTIYIPAGRSIITLFSQQLLHLYSIMDDAQKRTLDYCTQNYIERILRIKPSFSNGINDLLRYRGNSVFTDEKIRLALDLCHRILKGDYIFANGNEQIMLKDRKRVNINYASSGQQESVWILNLLIYYLSGTSSNTFIIEEPESNLFPESQKYITELITLAYNCGDSVIVTTHSPYVLGTLNNLIYAGQAKEELKEKVSQIIDDNLWIAKEDFTPYFVDKGKAEVCIERNTGLIQNELIDDISNVINTEYDQISNIIEGTMEN